MNIVHELNQLEYGGVERVIRNIIKYDKNNVHTVLSYKEGPFRKELEVIGAKVAVYDGKKDTNFEADVIHIHSGGGISNTAMNLGEHFPIVETIHSPIRSPIPSKVICQRVGVTEAVARLNGGITIHNGIDIDELQPTRFPGEIREGLGIPEGKIVIGRLGRVAHDKCLEEWLLTCYYLQKEGLDFVPLVVGGESINDSGYIGKLKLMAASLPVKDVIWAGHHADAANYLQVMDIFLYPSPTEGFGLVFAEAMLAGCVIVTYRNDITMEVTGGYAVLTDKSVQGLVAGTKQALEQSLRDEIQGMAPDFVRSEYDARRMSLDYQALYEELKTGK